MDVAALAVQRDYPAASDAVILGRIEARAEVADIAAETRKILGPGQALAARRVNAVGVVIDG